MSQRNNTTIHSNLSVSNSYTIIIYLKMLREDVKSTFQQFEELGLGHLASSSLQSGIICQTECG